MKWVPYGPSQYISIPELPPESLILNTYLTHTKNYLSEANY